MRITNKKINEAICWWENVYSGEIDFTERRYPPCIEHLNGVVAIADEDDNGSNLTMIDAKTFVKWIQNAKTLVKKWNNEQYSYDNMDALMDTLPQEKLRYLTH